MTKKAGEENAYSVFSCASFVFWQIPVAAETATAYTGGMRVGWEDKILPVLRKVRARFRESVGAAIVDERNAVGVVVAAVVASGRFGFSICTGQRFPLHTGAPAKAVLAFLPGARREALLKRIALTRFTATTVISRRAFRRELAEIRACGYAVDRAEEVEGCHCLAVPLLDPSGEPVAGLWFTGPSSRMPLERFPSDFPVLRALADEAQRAIFPQPDAVPRGAEKIERARARLETLPPGQEVDLAALARSLGMSYSSFRHAFRAQVGTAPAQYRLARRVAAASRELETSMLPLAQIAERTGFPSAAHFSTAFKKKTGLSPREYRAQRRGLRAAR